jgi:type I restriction enzyme, S subunit
MTYRSQAKMVNLTDVAELNPRRFSSQAKDDDLLSFVPMRSVEEESGKLVATTRKKWAEVKKGYTPFEDGDVIFAKITPCMENGKYALANNLHDGRAAGSTEFHVFRPKPELNSKYLLFFLFSPRVRREAKRSMRGAAGQLRVPPIFFEELQIPLPPLDEQQRIVAEIEKQFTRLDAGGASLKRVQTALKRYRASALKAACEGNWPLVKVADITTDVRYGTSAKTNENSEGIPVLRMGNISEGRLVIDKLKFLPKTHSEFPDLLLKPGDLLFNRTNSAELVGKTAVYGGNPEPCSFASYLIRVRLRDDYSPDFLSYYLNSIYGRQWIASVVSQQVGQANVNGTKLKALEIPNPPFDEQQRVVADVERRLSVIKGLELVVEANLHRADRLRQAMLHIAFSGCLLPKS